MITDQIKAEASKSRNPKVAMSLYFLMEHISEDLTFARWIQGNEFLCWQILKGTYLEAYFVEKYKRLLFELHRLCNGWWVWEDGPKFLNMEKWEAMYNSQYASKVHRS